MLSRKVLQTYTGFVGKLKTVLSSHGENVVYKKGLKATSPFHSIFLSIIVLLTLVSKTRIGKYAFFRIRTQSNHLDSIGPFKKRKNLTYLLTYLMN